jgi:cobalt-zinc-cadmium efflux system membrane fusion protein
MRAADLVFAFVAGAAMCGRPSRPPALEKPPPNEVWLDHDEIARAHVTVAVAEPQDVQDALVTPGRIAFDENRVTHLFSPVSGQVVAIDGRLGEHIPAGHRLAVILSPEVGQATSDLGKARADLVAAEHAFRRARALWPARAATLEDVEQAQDNLRSAQAEESRALEKTALFKAGPGVTQTFDVRAPIAGEILARTINPGLQVQGIYDGGTSPELFTVGDLDEVWVFSALRESELARVHLGARATVAALGIGPAFEGVVDWIAGMLNPQTRTAALRCVVRNRDEQLRPEMFGAVTVAATPLRVLAVPRHSLVHLGSATLLFFDRGLAPDARERFERLPVVVDEDLPGEYVPVSRGVEPGDRIVTNGVEELSAKM